tara:strand:- start:785 stop:1462 length:678 start_codon:yes stop_codon:yes gene_type:complete
MNAHCQVIKSWWKASLSLWVFFAPSWIPAEETAPKTTIPAGISFESYTLVLDNNIFDANRQDRARLEAERRRALEDTVPVDRFSLVGTMQHDGKALAFFSGTSSEYRVVLKPSEEIAGFEVREIRDKQIVIQRDDQRIEIAVGMGLSRQGEDPWKLIHETGADFRGAPGQKSRSRSSIGSSPFSQPEPATPAPTTSSDAPPRSSESSKSDILKRMMERRRQQMNQ